MMMRWLSAVWLYGPTEQRHSELHDLLVDYYLFGMTFYVAGKKHNCSDEFI